MSRLIISCSSTKLPAALEPMQWCHELGDIYIGRIFVADVADQELRQSRYLQFALDPAALGTSYSLSRESGLCTDGSIMQLFVLNSPN